MSNSTADDPGSFCEAGMYVEICYQFIFFAVGTPINLVNLIRDFILLRSSRRSITAGVGARRTLHLGLHLTLSNLTVLCIYCVAKTVWQLTYFWYGGEVLCRLFKFFGSFAYHSWSNIIVVIAMDMWYCVRSPLKSWSHGNMRIKIWLGVSWICAGLFAFPQLILNGLVQVPNEFRPDSIPNSSASLHQCVFMFVNYKRFGILYSLYHSLTIFYIPLVLITISYIGIRKSLSKQLNMRVQLQDKVCSSVSDMQDSTPLTHLTKERNSSSPRPSAVNTAPPQFVRFRRTSSIPANLGKLTNKNANVQKSAKMRLNAKSTAAATNISSVELREFAKSKLVKCRTPLKVFKRPTASKTLSNITSARSSDRGCEKKSANSDTKKRLLKMSLAVVLSYILCWSPYQIDALSRCICEILNIRTCASIFCKFEWLEGILILGACLNPFIYRFKATPSEKSLAVQRTRLLESRLSSTGAGTFSVIR